MGSGRPYGRRNTVERGYTPPAPAPDHRHGKVRLTALVEPEVHERAHRMAAAAGITASRLLAEMIARQELDENGAPVWIANLVDQEKLPMTG